MRADYRRQSAGNAFYSSYQLPEPGIEKNPRCDIAMASKIMINAIMLKMSILLCLAVSSFIFLDVDLASVISTMAVNIITLCSDVQ